MSMILVFLFFPCQCNNNTGVILACRATSTQQFQSFLLLLLTYQFKDITTAISLLPIGEQNSHHGCMLWGRLSSFEMGLFWRWGQLKALQVPSVLEILFLLQKCEEQRHTSAFYQPSITGVLTKPAPSRVTSAVMEEVAVEFSLSIRL